ncbi:hypothetical protein SI65_04613 [Aspergillus cristatus]|uniref:Uncharacterized protein n=1 Tax=Aspergillus cristatus TaxID=573508 RepID=A0A1E3BFF7_ASPCR|nr:hypothetical protein SI65_04613 [Aspergillus cristatus]
MPASPLNPNSNPPLQTLVDSLVHKYQKASPSPVFLDLLHKPDQYALLVNAIYRQISLIKRRSQALEDCQITIYDKALLELSMEGCYPIQTGVVELYLAEFLGLDETEKEDVKDALGKHVALQNVLNMRESESNPYTTRSKREPTSPRIKHEEPTKSETHSSPITTTISSGSKTSPQLNERVTRMLAVYHRAKEDYQRIKRRDNVEPLHAVRFLRDTAENTILYLRTNGFFEHELITELERTFDYARDKAAQLSGGRKRHFDDDWERQRERDRDRDRRGESGEKRSRSGRVIDSYRPGYLSK